MRNKTARDCLPQAFLANGRRLPQPLSKARNLGRIRSCNPHFSSGACKQPTSLFRSFRGRKALKRPALPDDVNRGGCKCNPPFFLPLATAGPANRLEIQPQIAPQPAPQARTRSAPRSRTQGVLLAQVGAFFCRTGSVLFSKNCLGLPSLTSLCTLHVNNRLHSELAERT